MAESVELNREWIQAIEETRHGLTLTTGWWAVV